MDKGDVDILPNHVTHSLGATIDKIARHKIHGFGQVLEEMRSLTQGGWFGEPGSRLVGPRGASFLFLPAIHFLPLAAPHCRPPLRC